VLPRVGLVGVHPSGLNVIESVPRPLEIPPEFQIPQNRLALDGFAARRAGQGLEVGLADEGGVVAVGLEEIAYRRHILGQLHADGPAAVAGWIETGDEAGPGGGAGGVGAIGPVEAGSCRGQTVQIGRFHLGIDDAQAGVVVLVRGDEKNVGLVHSGFSHRGKLKVSETIL
jgi:hypothetical protein